MRPLINMPIQETYDGSVNTHMSQPRDPIPRQLSVWQALANGKQSIAVAHDLNKIKHPKWWFKSKKHKHAPFCSLIPLKYIRWSAISRHATQNTYPTSPICLLLFNVYRVISLTPTHTLLSTVCWEEEIKHYPAIYGPVSAQSPAHKHLEVWCCIQRTGSDGLGWGVCLDLCHSLMENSAQTPPPAVESLPGVGTCYVSKGLSFFFFIFNSSNLLSSINWREEHVMCSWYLK